MTLIFQSDIARYYQIHGHILFIEITTHYLDEHIYRRFWRERDFLSKTYGLYHLISSHTQTYKLSRAAQRMSTSKESQGDFLSLAVVAKDKIMLFKFNLFLKISPFKIPQKAFDSLGKTIAWSVSKIIEPIGTSEELAYNTPNNPPLDLEMLLPSNFVMEDSRKMP